MARYNDNLNINIARTAKTTGIHPSTLRSRIERGTPPDKLFAPVGSYAKRLHTKYPAEYRIWAQIKHRCRLPNQKPIMAKAWYDFDMFLRDVGPRPSPNHQLRLKDRSLRYYNPDNVHWVLTNPRLPKKVTGRLDWLLIATPPED